MTQTARLSLPSLILVLVASLAYSQETAKRPTNAPAKNASPVEVYRTYLNAVKNNDLAAAKRCWTVSDKDEDIILDIVPGIFVASHHITSAIDKAGLDRKQFEGSLVREDCSDKAIDRTLARLKHSTFAVTGDKAALKIRWSKDDGSSNSVFCYGKEPIPFRKLPTGWKIDGNSMFEIEKPQVFLASPWCEEFRAQLKMSNEVAAGLESGELKTAKDVIRAIEKHTGSLEGRIPLTRTVIYLEDSPARYLQIKKGNPGVVSFSGARLPHRKDIRYPRNIEGNLNTIFSEMYGHPKIVVETKNHKGYEVVYDTDDKQAMQIVAKQLGMTVTEEEREILALRITVAKDGHHLKKVKKPDKPLDIQSLHGVTMDELALFLEARFSRPMINKTGLEGYYWLELSDETTKLFPQKIGEKKVLDKTGLQIHWERTKTKVLVIKDK